jgi:hypothetical protein
MPTAEEHLKADIGAQIAALLFQVAVLKAEVDRLREEVHRTRVAAPDGVPT